MTWRPTPQRCERMRIDRASAVHSPAAGGRRQSDSSRLAGTRLRGERKIKFMPNAYSIKVRGVVQGVGFRPFVYRLARANGLKGWVLNGEEGVEIHLEGEQGTLQSFLAEMKARPPQAAAIAEVRVQPAEAVGIHGVHDSRKHAANGSPPSNLARLAGLRGLSARTFRSARSRAITIRISTAPTAGRATA